MAFEVRDGKDLFDGGEKFIIWTTTPWTIPANLGISLHPDLEYNVVEANGEKYVLAHALLEDVAEELGWENVKVVKSFKGQEADRVVAKHPFYNRDSLVMLGEHVTTDAGTGCVHTAPGHGEDDFYVSKNMALKHFVQLMIKEYLRKKLLVLRVYSTMLPIKWLPKNWKKQVHY